MSTIVEFEVPSVFTFCRRVGHDGRIEVLRVVTAATCRNRKIGKFKLSTFILIIIMFVLFILRLLFISRTLKELYFSWLCADAMVTSV